MKTLQEILDSHTISSVEMGKDGFRGVYTSYKWQGSIICSTGGGWEHVSVSPFKRNYIPTWEDMCRIKDIFWNDDEAVIQIHPAKEEYVNNMPNCLHLWRCSYAPMLLPPSCFVGIKNGQTRSELEKEIRAALKSECEYDHNILKAHSDGAREVLDNIIAEIQKLRGCSCSCSDGIIDDIEDIIDKYREVE